jgi:hypothetical protein
VFVIVLWVRIVVALGRSLRTTKIAADCLVAWILPCAEVFDDRGRAASGLKSVPIVFEAIVARRLPLWF